MEIGRRIGPVVRRVGGVRKNHGIGDMSHHRGGGFGVEPHMGIARRMMVSVGCVGRFGVILDQFDPFRGGHHLQRGISGILDQRRHPHLKSGADFQQERGPPHRHQVTRFWRVGVFALIARHERSHVDVRAADLLRPVLQDRERHDDVEWFGSSGTGGRAGRDPMKRHESQCEQGEREQTQHPADGNTRFPQSQRGESASAHRHMRLTGCRVSISVAHRPERHVLRLWQWRSGMKVVGLMSGTSADAVDAVLVSIARRGRTPRISTVAFASVLYPRSLQQRIMELSLHGRVDQICHMNVYLGELFAKAALRVIRKAGYLPADIDLIGSHGQTIHHLPNGIREAGVGLVRSTLQIGEPSVIAERTGITTVANFRPRDMAAGGEGAPLVPYAHAAAFAHPRRGRLVVNIGGISNVTYLPPGGGIAELQAFDTGPGNMVMDGIVGQVSKGRRRYDAGGRLAMRGNVSHRLLATLISHPFLARCPPKSTGREEFGAPFVRRLVMKQQKGRLSTEDLLATCAAWTAEAIGSSRRWLVGDVDEVIVGGGGVRNRAVMGGLRQVFAPAPVSTFDDHGWSSHAFEATAFALLAHDTYRGQCTNVPQVTGARHAVLLGVVAPGSPSFRRKGPHAAR